MAGSAKALKMSDSIPYPFYEVQKSKQGLDNHFTVLNSGIASLQARIDLIRSAQSNIEVEYFIYGLDDSSKIFSLELIEAAKRGVKVRLLIDMSLAVFELDKYYAKAFSEHGVEVKYYNTAAAYRVSSINFRNHRKLISVDDRAAITGGRNIGDDYFDLSTKFNFLDRDVLVEGPIVKTIRASFDEYFTHKISKSPRFPKKPEAFKIKKRSRYGKRFIIKEDNSRNLKMYENKMAKAREFLTETDSTIELRKKIEDISRPILDSKKSYLCPETTYSTDRPGGNFKTRLFKNYSDNYRYLRKTLFDKLVTINHKLYISSLYMLNNEESKELMDLLLDRKVEITMYTNSLASTDAVYVAANLYRDVFKWAGLGMSTNVHNGKYIPLTEQDETISPEVKSATWGTHSKTHIYESIDQNGDEVSEVMIGTYNIDNRSNYYNSEMAVFCKGNPELTSEIKDSMYKRMNNGFQIHEDKTATNKNGDSVSIYGTSSKKKTLMRLISIPSRLLKFLL